MKRDAPKERDDLAYARALADADDAAVRTFERRDRLVVRHALGRALRTWKPEAPVEPEDLVQDFVGFLFEDGGRRLRTYQGRSSFKSWLYTVAVRWFQRQLARRRADRRGEADLGLRPDGRHTPEGAAMAAQSAAAVRTAVAALPPEDQLYVRLFFVEGLNATEVAQRLGKGKSAVRMRKMRIIERLRGLLGGEV